MRQPNVERLVRTVLLELPPHVKLVAAAKTRSPEEVDAALRAGIRAIGYNYVQEAEKIRPFINAAVEWHMIGHLQRNKVKKAVQLFDIIETVDSIKLAAEIDKNCAELNKTMPILIEINSAREKKKTGVFPEQAEQLVRAISSFGNIRVKGLMTMGPMSGDGEDARPYFRSTKSVFDDLKMAAIANVEMVHLSMGMSNSYRIAVEEGANIVRIGTLLFGHRQSA